jgi:ankyrin repeat protein
MRIGAILVPLTVIIMAGFMGSNAAGKENFAAVEAIADQKLSSRPTPAQITQETEDSLVKRGFVRIGEISVEEVTGTYWKSEKIPETVPSRDVTTPLLRQAAEHGGDLVILKRDNSPDSYQVTKKGKVLTWQRQSRQEAYQQRSGTGDAGYTAYRTVYYNVPTSWETIQGTEQAVRSAGSVWRNDSELANRIGPKLEAERQERLQRQQAVGEADRQALLLLQEAERQVVVPRPAGAIHDAVRVNNIEKVKALLSNGADVNARDKMGDTPLHVAANFNARDVAELLLAKGADVNARGDLGVTPLHLAAIANSKAVAELLLTKGADVNRKSEDGMTPMHVAAASNAGDVAELLLVNGADLNAKSNTGSTPLHLAAMYDARDVAELLLANGADVNAKVNNERTPLHLAAFRNAKEVTELLLTKGADLNAKDKDGKTPLALAVQAGNSALANILRAQGAKE